MYIAISGLIGAGKTTLANKLSQHLGINVYYEPVNDNLYLNDFYKSPEKYSFAMQIYLFNKRFSQIQKITDGVQDRTIYEDMVFARCLYESGLMNDRDYNTYFEFMQNMKLYIRKPDYIIHLNVSPEESIRRIKMRKRECESTITLEYLQHLNENYKKFVKEISKEIRVIEIDYENFIDLDQILKKIT
jgi:deoxyadenosine kinase